MEGETATHSNTLAWKIPWTEEPGMLQSIGSQRIEISALQYHLQPELVEHDLEQAI